MSEKIKVTMLKAGKTFDGPFDWVVDQIAKQIEKDLATARQPIKY